MTRPRLGFLGVGWIGRSRLQAIRADGAVEVAVVADPSRENLDAALALAPEAELAADEADLLDRGLDGIVIATPSASHAGQSERALARGSAVFCQKPLGRTASEAATVVEAARAADLLLGADLSYRGMEATRRIRAGIAAGEIGRVFACDLTFHNAYGPDKPWFYDVALSGGGCVMDLGVHLVDLALWCLDAEGAEVAHRSLHAGGRELPPDPREVEDHATAALLVHGDVDVRIACSWRLHAGRDCVIEALFHGTAGGFGLRNVGGSFYDVVAERYDGTSTTTLCGPPDAWGGRVAVEWARSLAAGARFDPAVEVLVGGARVLDAIYGRTGPTDSGRSTT
jgi:predicted dehydrogenase